MKYPILILHGWGHFIPGQHRFAKVKELLEKSGYTVFAPDLPGFGANELTKEELFFEDYVNFVKSVIEKNKLSKVVLIGHSFGGRIAIAFTAKYPQLVSKLILASPSGIPHKLSPKKRLISIIAKVGKQVLQFKLLESFYKPLRKLLYKSIGETDYYKSGSLKKTFRNIYQVSIVNDLPKISVPTLVIWGEMDTFVPVIDAHIMHKIIAKSKMTIWKNAGHKFPYEYPEKFVKEVLEFLS